MAETLTSKQQELLKRIMALELDDPESSLSFTSRLAREQAWTHAFSERVIEEYKCFIALAMLAGHPVTPSEEVDQVWHLHLIYTRSYWLDLCRDTLNYDLHHGPTKGGQNEGAKFCDWYSKTLASYQQLFDTQPPPDIWPSPRDRFANAGSGRWINPTKFWLFPKPRLWRRLFRSC